MTKLLAQKKECCHACIIFTLSRRLVGGFRKAPRELEEELTFLLAVKLFEVRRLSLGKAAEFCHMGKIRFMFELGRLGVPVINLDDDQIADELRDE